MSRALLAAAALAAGVMANALAQTAEDLRNDDRTPGDVLTYGMGYSQQRHSPLTRINRDNVKRLVPVWSFATSNVLGDESQPLLHDGVIYLTTSRHTFAIDALSGKAIWRHDVDQPADLRMVCCGQVSRGAAIYGGKLYRTTLDMHVVALDIKTGKEVWRTQSDDFKLGYSMTAAPLVANGVVIAGVAGAEFGVRGYLEAFDAESGQKLWRLWTVPAPGEPGSDTWPKNDLWKVGGAATWLTGSYDPELDLVYWGTVEPDGAPGRQPVLLLSAGDPSENRRDRVVSAVHPARPHRFRRQQRDDPRRPGDRRAEPQGADARRPQRLSLRAGSHERRAARRQFVRRQDDLGRRRRHADRPPDPHRGIQEVPGRERGRAVAGGERRQELASGRL
jgi:hypothetical protein